MVNGKIFNYSSSKTKQKKGSSVMNKRDKRIDNQDCICDYAESGLCTECPGSKPMSKNKVTLGGCYHDSLAYSLGYDANGVIELTGETFTNLNIGLNGGAMTALRKHREQFDPGRDVEQFIVALKPVEVILGREDDEDYKLGDNETCNLCGKNHNDWNTPDYDVCGNCGEFIEDCTCSSDDDCINCGYDICGDCGERIENCTCDKDCLVCGLDPTTCGCWNECCTINEFDRENVSDTFRQMNAFARARWLKAQGKLQGE